MTGVVSAHTDTVRPSLIALTVLRVRRKQQREENKVTSHAAKYRFPGDERTEAVKENVLCFKIKQCFCFSFTYSGLFLVTSGRACRVVTLKAAQAVSTSRYKRTDAAKLHQLTSVQKQSVKLLISFFFL